METYQALNDIINHQVYMNWAEDAQNAWMRTKIEQGWTFGEVRDDIKKTNPAIKAFNELDPLAKGKNLITPYATVNFLRRELGHLTTQEFCNTIDELIEGNQAILLEKGCEYVHAAFATAMLARGETDRDDLIIYENLAEDVKTWDKAGFIDVAKNVKDYVIRI